LSKRRSGEHSRETPQRGGAEEKSAAPAGTFHRRAISKD
jgi:hypothetical protein